MTLSKRSLLAAALASVLIYGTIYGKPTLSDNKNLPDQVQIGDTKYVVEMENEDPTPIMLLLRERGTSKVIGTISFDDKGDVIAYSPGKSGDARLNGNGPRSDAIPGLDNSVAVNNGNNGLISGPLVRNNREKDNRNGLLDRLDDNVPADVLNNGGSGGTIPSSGGSSGGTLPVPEPSAIVLSAAGLIIIGLLKLRQAKA